MVVLYLFFLLGAIFGWALCSIFPVSSRADKQADRLMEDTRKRVEGLLRVENDEHIGDAGSLE